MHRRQRHDQVSFEVCSGLPARLDAVTSSAMVTSMRMHVRPSTPVRSAADRLDAHGLARPHTDRVREAGRSRVDARTPEHAVVVGQHSRRMAMGSPSGVPASRQHEGIVRVTPVLVGVERSKRTSRGRRSGSPRGMMLERSPAEHAVEVEPVPRWQRPLADPSPSIGPVDQRALAVAAPSRRSRTADARAWRSTLARPLGRRPSRSWRMGGRASLSASTWIVGSLPLTDPARTAQTGLSPAPRTRRFGGRIEACRRTSWITCGRPPVDGSGLGDAVCAGLVPAHRSVEQGTPDARATGRYGRCGSQACRSAPRPPDRCAAGRTTRRCRGATTPGRRTPRSAPGLGGGAGSRRLYG